MRAGAVSQYRSILFDHHDQQDKVQDREAPTHDAVDTCRKLWTGELLSTQFPHHYGKGSTACQDNKKGQDLVTIGDTFMFYSS